MSIINYFFVFSFVLACKEGNQFTSESTGTPYEEPIPVVTSPEPNPVAPEPLDPIDPEPVPEPDIEPLPEPIQPVIVPILDKCQQPGLRWQNVPVNFPATRGRVTCPFQPRPGDGSEVGVDSAFSAFHIQQVSIPIPQGVTVCDLNLTGSQQNFVYDDQLFLLVNGFVLMSSLNVMSSFSSSDGILRVFDWQRIYGQNHNQNPGATCIQGTTFCQLPLTQQVGSVGLVLGQQANLALMTEFTKSNVLNFDLVITGDDNPDKDCQHSGLSFTVRYSYAL